jgi:hypothetical protein
MELNSERKRASKMSLTQGRLYKDLSELSNIVQDAKALRDAVTTMFKKYSKHLDNGGSLLNIEDESETKKALEEIMRQKAFLER